MIHFSKNFKFKKQSESLPVDIKDKKITQQRKELLKLHQENQKLTKILQNKNTQFLTFNKQIMLQYQSLNILNTLQNQKIIKLQIKRDRLLANSPNQTISQKYLNNLKKYLISYSVAKLYQSYNYFGMGSVSNYKILKQYIKRIELKYLIKKKLNKIAIIKKCLFEGRLLMLIAKQQSLQQICVSIFNLTKQTPSQKSFCLKTSYNPIKFSDNHYLYSISKQNPFLNLVILLKKKKVVFLTEYLSENYAMMYTVIKKFQFKIQRQIQRRNILFYKVFDLNKFYQTFYEDFKCKYSKNEYTEQVCLKCLIMVRLKVENKQKYWQVTIQTIKSYAPKYNFIINHLIQQKQNHQQFSLEKFFQKIIISLKYKKLLKLINFKNDKTKYQCIRNYKKLVKIQTYFKIKIEKKKLKAKKSLNVLQNPHYNFRIIYNNNSKILLTIIKKTQINVYFECLNVKNNTHKLTYQQKYWKILTNYINFMINYNMDTLQQTRDMFQSQLNLLIQKYEEDCIQMQMQKPLKYESRLKKFFVNIFLRMKVKKNIKFIKKLAIKTNNTSLAYINSTTQNMNMNKCLPSWNYVLIVRKSKMLKNVVDINLYRLYTENQWISAYKLNTNSLIKEQSINQKDQTNQQKIKKIKRLSIKVQEESKIKNIFKHQSIHLFENYFDKYGVSNIEDEFYIHPQHFMLKPPKKPKHYYIDRIVPLDINSAQISKEIINYEIQYSGPKKTHNRRQGHWFNRGSMLPHLENNNTRDVINNQLLQNDSMVPIRLTYTVKQNHHRNIIYYTLYKNDQTIFYLEIYIVSFLKNASKPNKSYDEELILVHREEVPKKQLIQSNYRPIYTIIAKWLKNQNRLIQIEDQNLNQTQNQTTLIIGSYIVKGLNQINHQKASNLSNQTITNSVFFE